jgi:hypothetical protein
MIKILLLVLLIMLFAVVLDRYMVSDDKFKIGSRVEFRHKEEIKRGYIVEQLDPNDFQEVEEPVFKVNSDNKDYTVVKSELTQVLTLNK